MKKILSSTSLVAGLLCLLASSCSKKIDEAYANPNADVKVPVEQLLPAITSCMGANGAGHGPYNDYRTLGKYIQNWQFCNANDLYDRMSGRSIPLGSTAADQTASIFRMHYYDIGQNCMRMIQWATEDKKWDYVGVGKAIFAWSWLTLTDVQGECILNDAFDQSKITFTYQTQEEVYNYVRQLSYDALNYLNRTGDGASPTNLALGDAYMYGGDVNKWKKFVYSVLARSFNHLTNKSIYQPDSVIKYCDLAINTNADNAMQKFAWTPGSPSGTANFFGPFRNNFSSVVDGSNYAIRQGSYIANLLNGTNTAFGGVADPRAIYLLRKNTNNTFVGVVPVKGQAGIPVAADRPETFFGVSQTAGLNNTAPGNDNNCRFIFRNTSPLPVITAAEIKFMKAEAAFKKGNKAMAWDAYKEGISLHFDLLTSTYNVNIPVGEEITPAVKAAYMSNPNVVPVSSANLTLTQIMMQKYIALFGLGVLEAWTDMRRYHYTDIDPATSQQVYLGFTPPAGSDLHPTNNGRYVYRVYPRYNSETVWNIQELVRIGADKTDFHTKECWFSLP